MISETMIETPVTANNIQSRPYQSPSPGYKSPSPPNNITLASHLLAAVSQVQSLSSQLPPSIQLPNCSPPPPGMGYRPGFLGVGLPQLPLGSETHMQSLLAGLKDFPRPYHSPPPLPSTESHECKIVEVRGAKIAAFLINGDQTMLCLPQVFEIFLKHLVGGLHTVYTKLKRLGIEPIVCNVDQVRILRGLGAIQPGVNRCKLLSAQHFDILYRDCTTASSRPGRPPKRASDFMSMASSPDALFELKKRHLENGIGSGPHPFSNGHIGSDHRIDKSPLLANGYNAPPNFNPLQYMAQHMAGLGYPPMLPGGLTGGLPPISHAPSHQISPPERSPIKQLTPESLARMHENRVDRERQMILDARRNLPPTSISSIGTHPNSHFSPINPSTSTAQSPTPIPPNDPPASSPILNLSKIPRGAEQTSTDDEETHTDRKQKIANGEEDLTRRNHSKSTSDISFGLPPPIVSTSEPSQILTDRHQDDSVSEMEDDDHLNKDHITSPAAMDTGEIWSGNSSTPGMTRLSPPIHHQSSVGSFGGLGNLAPLSSTEVLLRNILGLLRVAEENARHHERQTQYEKAELKMEVLRERELRETLERQLQEEQRNRILMQKRCAKLKKLRRRLQERLDDEVKRRRFDDQNNLKNQGADALNVNGSLRKDMEAIAAELQQENLQHQENNRGDQDRLLASPSLANHPAVAAANAVVSNSSWR